MIAKIDAGISLEVRTCPVCFINYALPIELVQRKKREGGDWYCPNGHNLVFTESETDKLRKQLESAKSDAKYWQNRKNEVQQQKDFVERSLAAQKGQVTKLKKRISNGVCPCCSRHFTNVERHIKTKHPEFVETASRTRIVPTADLEETRNA